MVKSFTRGGVLPLTYLVNLKPYQKEREYVIINDCKIKITSQRYEVFNISHTCPDCGLVASFLAYEKPLNCETYHINMYGIKDNEEILFTKDHIYPKSKGGANAISNYRTMCEFCNKEKGDKILK